MVQANQNAMHGAAQGGHLEVVKFLSPMFGTRILEMDNDGWTSLHHAARFGHCQVARYLIEELKIDPKDKSTVCWPGAGEVQHLCMRYL